MCSAAMCVAQRLQGVPGWCLGRGREGARRACPRPHTPTLCTRSHSPSPYACLPRRQRVILSTPIAESSVTIDGVVAGAASSQALAHTQNLRGGACTWHGFTPLVPRAPNTSTLGHVGRQKVLGSVHPMMAHGEGNVRNGK